MITIDYRSPIGIRGGGNFSSMLEFSSSIATADDNLKEMYNLTAISADTVLTLSSVDIAKGTPTRALNITILDTSGDIVSSGFDFIIDTEGSETIEGQPFIKMTVDYGVLRLFADGSNVFFK